MHRPVIIALAFLASSSASSSAFADTPVLDAAVLVEPCAAAKALDACPACACDLTTQSIPYHGPLESEATTVPIGGVLLVRGTKDNGEEYEASHVVLGTVDKLEHVGRLAETHQEGPVANVTYTVEGAAQVMQACPGGCAYEAMGRIHPFIVTTLHTEFDMDSPKETVREDKRLVLCFEGPGGTTCASMPLASETRTTMPGATLEARRKVLERAGYERTWKFGKEGDVAFGKATGKRSSELARPEAFKVQLMDLFGIADTTNLPR